MSSKNRKHGCPINLIYETDEYTKLRQQQAHFSERRTGFDNCDNKNYHRYISPLTFDDKIMMEGYNMWIPQIGQSYDEDDLIFITIGEWNWDKKTQKWIFYRSPSQIVDWTNQELNQLINEGTKILCDSKFIPNLSGWCWCKNLREFISTHMSL